MTTTTAAASTMIRKGQQQQQHHDTTLRLSQRSIDAAATPLPTRITTVTTTSNYGTVGKSGVKEEDSVKKIVVVEGTESTALLDEDDDDDDDASSSIYSVRHHVDDKNDPFESLSSFDTFEELTHVRHYCTLPPDWWILVADIQGSTAAIEAGRYRDVNTVGVMCIAAVRNALLAQQQRQQRDHASHHKSLNDMFPYVFGGDGASMVVRPSQKATALQALMALKRLARQQFQLHLRVGAVSVGQVQAAGATVQVARYEITPGLCLALFQGGGLALADALVKNGQEEQDDDDNNNYQDWQDPSVTDDDDDDDDAYYEFLEQGATATSSVPPPPLPEPNLDGLSCRWHKIPNQRGCVLTLLVMANPDYSRAQQTTMYQRVLQGLRHILACSNDNNENSNNNNNKLAVHNNPVNVELATYKTARQMIKEEKRLHGTLWSVAWVLRCVEILLCHVLFYWRILQHTIIDVPAYVQAMRTHADYCKFDDMLRMVLDCTPDQATAIETMLQKWHGQGRQVFYGTLRSQHSLMTCLLEDTAPGKHVHFVDGDNGGYALAAKQLKIQLGKYAMQKRGGCSIPTASTSSFSLLSRQTSLVLVKRKSARPAKRRASDPIVLR